MPKLYQIRNSLNLKNRKIVYTAWEESYLMYGIEVYAFTTASLLQKLQKVQNKIVKILFKNNTSLVILKNSLGSMIF